MGQTLRDLTSWLHKDLNDFCFNYFFYFFLLPTFLTILVSRKIYVMHSCEQKNALLIFFLRNEKKFIPNSVFEKHLTFICCFTY